MYMQGKGSVVQTRAHARESGGKAAADCIDRCRTLEYQAALLFALLVAVGASVPL
jgi:hypothetical protein